MEPPAEVLRPSLPRGVLWGGVRLKAVCRGIDERLVRDRGGIVLEEPIDPLGIVEEAREDLGSFTRATSNV